MVNWSFVNPYVRLNATCFVDVSPLIVTIFYMDMDMVFNATFNNISVIYRGCQFYWWRKPEYPEKTIDLSKINDKFLSQNFTKFYKMVRIRECDNIHEFSFFCLLKTTIVKLSIMS